MLCSKSACSVSWRLQWHTCFFVRRRSLVIVSVIPLSGPRRASQYHRSSFTGIWVGSPQKKPTNQPTNQQTNKQTTNKQTTNQPTNNQPTNKQNGLVQFLSCKSCSIPSLLGSFGISLGSLSHLAALLLQTSSALPQYNQNVAF